MYGVTRSLQKRFGAARVFDSLLDEQSILGIALGAGVSGLVPIPEIQYLAYLHNAEDQLRGEAASLSFFSNGQYRNPLVVRIAGYAYQTRIRRSLPQRQRGRRVARHPRSRHRQPGASVRRRTDAADLRGGSGRRRHGVRVPRTDRPVPHTRSPRPRRRRLDRAVRASRRVGPCARADRRGTTGPRRRRRARRVVGERTGDLVAGRPTARVRRRVVSGVRPAMARTRCPSNSSSIRLGRSVGCSWSTRRVTRAVSARVSSPALVEGGFTGPIARVAAVDSFVPLGDAANLVLVGVDDVVATCRRMLG